MKLTDEQIMEIWRKENIPANGLMFFARAIAAEQRKIDAETCMKQIYYPPRICQGFAEAILTEGE
jgi:hypothetical protein